MDTKKILLVEDEKDIREIYARQLDKAGFTVTSVGDGDQALEELKKDTFDLLLLDIMLPKKNGLEVLKEFKQIKPDSSMKVIIVSNVGNADVMKEGFALGAVSYLMKVSCNPDSVVSQVQNILNIN